MEVEEGSTSGDGCSTQRDPVNEETIVLAVGVPQSLVGVWASQSLRGSETLVSMGKVKPRDTASAGWERE